MSSKKFNSKKRDEDGKFISSKTTITKSKEKVETPETPEKVETKEILKEVETPVVENTNDVKTRHGSTIHFS